MGIYSLNNINESSLLDVEEVEIHQEDFMEAALNIAYESAVNVDNIMQAIGIQELAVYESTGQEIVYEAGGAGIIAKLKEAIKKLWAKIKSLFTKFFAKMQSFGKNDKEFVNKYKKQILKGSSKGLKVKGFKRYDFSLEVGSSFSKMKTFIEGDISKKDDSEVSDGIRGAVFGKGDMDSNEFNKELYERFRGGEDTKEEVEIGKDINVGQILQFLSGDASQAKDIRKDYTDTEKEVKNILKSLDKSEKDLLKLKDNSGNPKQPDQVTKDSKALNNISKKGRAFNTALSVSQVIDGAKMKAFNEKRAFYKSICVKLIGRKEPKNEGYDFENDYNGNPEFANILGGIKLI